MAKATFYIQLQPEFRQYGRDWDGEPKLNVSNLSAKRVTQKYPRDPLPGSVVAKLTLSIPDEALLPLSPKVEIEVPIEHLAVVVASDPVGVVE